MKRRTFVVAVLAVTAVTGAACSHAKSPTSTTVKALPGEVPSPSDAWATGFCSSVGSWRAAVADAPTLASKAAAAGPTFSEQQSTANGLLLGYSNANAAVLQHLQDNGFPAVADGRTIELQAETIFRLYGALITAGQSLIGSVPSGNMSTLAFRLAAVGSDFRNGANTVAESLARLKTSVSSSHDPTVNAAFTNDASCRAVFSRS